jgi:hypothetical protein
VFQPPQANSSQSNLIFQFREERLNFPSFSLIAEEVGLFGSLPCMLPHSLFDMDHELFASPRRAFFLS